LPEETLPDLPVRGSPACPERFAVFAGDNMREPLTPSPLVRTNSSSLGHDFGRLRRLLFQQLEPYLCPTQVLDSISYHNPAVAVNDDRDIELHRQIPQVGGGKNCEN
jgi:hypothetical protein